MYKTDSNVLLCLCCSDVATEDGEVKLREGARPKRRTDEAEIILGVTFDIPVEVINCIIRV